MLAKQVLYKELMEAPVALSRTPVKARGELLLFTCVQVPLRSYVPQSLHRNSPSDQVACGPLLGGLLIKTRPQSKVAPTPEEGGGGGGEGDGGDGGGGGGGREAPATARVRHETVSAVSTCASERSVSPPALRPTLTIVGVRVVSVGQAVPKAVNQPRFVSYSRWVGEDGRNAQHRRDPR
jgi:hypothetical protein